jgi:hypothetical protein
LPTALKNSTADIYADDTTISYSDHYKISPQAISNGIQTDMNALQNWSNINRMTLNERKTKSMLITGKRLDKKLESLDLQIELNNTTIEQVDVFSLLGLKIDRRLTFDEHIDSLCNKLSQRIGVLRKIKVFLPLEQRILYYNAMIKQPMMYGSTVWSACSRENLERVLRLQKRAARVILDADMRANSAELFKKLNRLPFFCEVKIQMCVLTHKRLYGECPAYIKEMLRVNSDIHNRSSRYGSINIVCPRFKRETEGGRTFSVRMSRIWNSLPNELKSIQNINIFRSSLRTFYIDTLKDMNYLKNFKTFYWTIGHKFLLYICIYLHACYV